MSLITEVMYFFLETPPAFRHGESFRPQHLLCYQNVLAYVSSPPPFQAHCYSVLGQEAMFLFHSRNCPLKLRVLCQCVSIRLFFPSVTFPLHLSYPILPPWGEFRTLSLAYSPLPRDCYKLFFRNLFHKSLFSRYLPRIQEKIVLFFLP